MLKKYIYIFLISMVPLIELRGAVPVSQVMGLTNQLLEGSSASALKKERRVVRSFRQRPEEVCLLHFYFS